MVRTGMKVTKRVKSRAARGPSGQSILDSFGKGNQLFPTPAVVSVDEPISPNAAWVNHLREVVGGQQGPAALLLNPLTSSGQREGLRGVEVLTSLGYEGVYITFNQKYESLRKKLVGHGADCSRLQFVDGVSMREGGTCAEDPQVVFVNSPDNFTEVSVAIDASVSALGEGKKFIWLDSLHDLLDYKPPEKVATFAKFLVNKHGSTGRAMPVFSLRERDGNCAQLHQIIKPYCDHVLEIP